MHTATDCTEMQRIKLTDIDVNDYNARSFTNMTPQRQNAFEELVASVRENGIIQPILLRPVVNEGGEVRYEVVAGERRYRAACRVAEERGTKDVEEIPATIRKLDNDSAYDLMVIENLQREGLTPIEEARAFKDLMEKRGGGPDTVKDIARRVGITPVAVRLRVALLEMPQPVLEAWEKEEITTGHVEELSRLGEEKEILAALTETLRCKFTIKELEAHIKNQKPAMSAARFDTTECALCVSNGAAQTSMFEADTADGCCLQPECFRTKQENYLTDHWPQSKAKEIYGTNSFRFNETLTVADYRIIKAETPHQRCLECPEFVSIITVAVKGIHPRACVGKQECFDELYAPPKKEKTSAKKTKSVPDQSKKAQTGNSGKKTQTESGPTEKDLTKRAEKRGLEQREKFFAEAIPAKVATIKADTPTSVYLMLSGILASSESARQLFIEMQNMDTLATKEAVIAKALSLEVNDLLPVLQKVALKPLMETESYHSASNPRIRHLIAQKVGIDLSKEWQITAEYLKSMNKAEMVKVCEEVGLLENEKVKAYRDEHFGNKGWRSLKNKDFITCIMESGIDLGGIVPQEILS